MEPYGQSKYFPGNRCMARTLSDLFAWMQGVFFPVGFQVVIEKTVEKGMIERELGNSCFGHYGVVTDVCIETEMQF